MVDLNEAVLGGCEYQVQLEGDYTATKCMTQAQYADYAVARKQEMKTESQVVILIVGVIMAVMVLGFMLSIVRKVE